MKRRGLLFCSAILFVFATTNTFGNKIQETKTARASYDVSAMDRIDVEGKNVQFLIQAGPSGKVEVVAEIVFKGKETDKIREFLDNFDEEVKDRITKGGGRLYIDADLDEPFKVQMGKKGGARVGYNEEELKITYTITVPGENDFSIKNSYQDISMRGEYKGKTAVSLYSANFAGEIYKELDLQLKFGKGELLSVEKSKMELYEQKLAIQEVKELDLSTKFSKCDFSSAGSVNLDAYESKLSFGELGQLSGAAKFGRIVSSGIMERFEIDSYEVDMEFGEISSAKFIKSKFCDIKARKIESLQLPDSYEDSFVISELGSLKVNSKFGDFEIGRLLSSARVEGYETDLTIDGLGREASLITVDGKFNKLYLATDGVPLQLKGDLTFGDVDYPEGDMERKIYIKENNKLQIELVSKSGNPSLSIDLKGYETKAEIQ